MHIRACRESLRGAVGGALLGEAERQVELGGGGPDRFERKAQSRQLEARIGIVLESQHDLEQRVTGERAGRVEHLDQALERQVLMAVGRQIGGAHALEQIAEARIAARIGAQHQRVDEEADEIVERAVGAPRNRAADRDVGPGAKLREQRRQPRLQHHEQTRPALARKLEQVAMKLGVDVERNAVAAIARDRRSRPVDRQLDLIGKILERVGPERQLARNGTVRIALAAEQLVLPQRVVGILHRQGRQLRRMTLTARPIGRRKIARERNRGPAVARNMMQQEQQHVLVRTEHKQMRPQGRLGRKIEAVARRRGERLRKSLLADRHHLQPRPRRGRLQDQLAGHAQRIGEDGAQALVAFHQVSQRRFQRRTIERTRKPQRERDVIGCAAPLQTVEEPQPTLRKRERDLGRTRLVHQRGPRRLRLGKTLGQTLHGRGLEQAADRNFHIQGDTDAADQPGRQQRMTTEFEEVVVDADALER